MNGRVSTPIKAVNSSSTAVSLCLKYCSTRYLSKCVEIAHSTGPENAKTSQDISFAALGGGQAQGGTIATPSMTNCSAEERPSICNDEFRYHPPGGTMGKPEPRRS